MKTILAIAAALTLSGCFVATALGPAHTIKSECKQEGDFFPGFGGRPTPCPAQEIIDTRGFEFGCPWNWDEVTQTATCNLTKERDEDD